MLHQTFILQSAMFEFPTYVIATSQQFETLCIALWNVRLNKLRPCGGPEKLQIKQDIYCLSWTLLVLLIYLAPYLPSFRCLSHSLLSHAVSVWHPPSLHGVCYWAVHPSGTGACSSHNLPLVQRWVLSTGLWFPSLTCLAFIHHFLLVLANLEESSKETMIF